MTLTDEAIGLILETAKALHAAGIYPSINRVWHKVRLLDVSHDRTKRAVDILKQRGEYPVRDRILPTGPQLSPKKPKPVRPTQPVDPGSFAADIRRLKILRRRQRQMIQGGFHQ